ncbi:MAG TPA: trypsin-like peptidase domain-containing protein [Solirubrobacterales bacterium]
MNAKKALAAALLALALLAGCGSSDGGPGDEETVTTAGETTERVVVETSDDGFDPAAVYRAAAPGVVTIRSILDAGAAEGSGFVLDGDGRIVTNAHVVTDESSGKRKAAKEVFVEFPDRNVVSAEIVGFDPFADVALLEVDPDGLDLHPLVLGSDETLVPGQPVAAIGSPFGQQHSLSVGIISATDRSVQSLTQFQIEGAIQTDASINPGNSGGPLLDADAKVVGINQQIETESGANDGVGFAVPVSAIKRSLDQLEEDGDAEYAYVGVSTQALYPQLAAKLDLDVDYGGLVAEVVDDGPADRAGVRDADGKITFQGIPVRTGGDVILSVDGRKVVRPEDLARYITSFRPGDEVTVEVLRDGDVRTVEVTLGKRPDDPGV